MDDKNDNACAVLVEDMGMSSRLTSMDAAGIPWDVQESCPACGAKLETCARLAPDDGSKTVRYGLCAACGYMGYIDRPTQKWIIDFYSKDWDKEFVRPPEEMRADADAMMAGKGKQSRKIAADLALKIGDKARTACEIGTGYGLVLEYLKRHGFTRLMGVENSKHRADLVKKVFGFEVLHGGFEEESVQSGLREAGTIGLFFCHHVFEHTYHPDDIIRKAAAHQKEGDILLFAMPNADGEHLQYAVLYLLHLHSFTKEALERLFNRHGYEIVEDASPDPTNIIIAARKVAQPKPRFATGRDHRAEFRRRFRRAFALDAVEGDGPYAVYWEQKPHETDLAKVERSGTPAMTAAWWHARKALDFVKSRWFDRFTAGHRLLLRKADKVPEDGLCEVRFTGPVRFYSK